MLQHVKSHGCNTRRWICPYRVSSVLEKCSAASELPSLSPMDGCRLVWKNWGERSKNWLWIVVMQKAELCQRDQAS